MACNALMRKEEREERPWRTFEKAAKTKEDRNITFTLCMCLDSDERCVYSKIDRASERVKMKERKRGNE